MFTEYLRKILPIPIVRIEVNEDGYKYRITTYASVIDERQTDKAIRTRIIKNKRIKSFSGWFYKDNDVYYKQAVIEFVK